MSTYVSLHVLVPDWGESLGLDCVPRDLEELLAGVGQPGPHGTQSMEYGGKRWCVLQLRLNGTDKLSDGQALLAEVEKLDYVCRLHVHHRSATASSSWWPDPPPWPHY